MTRSCPWYRFLLPAILLLAPCPSARAKLNAEARKPYDLVVVFDVAPHRLLTDVFIDQVENDLKDILQDVLDDLARVRVVRAERLLKEVWAQMPARGATPQQAAESARLLKDLRAGWVKKGLTERQAEESARLLREVWSKGLEKALNGYGQVGDAKIHFVRLRFASGRYELEARQHDGLTGLSSPLVREDRTTDRRRVARKAALLVDQDFGLVGTVTKVDGTRVEVTIKGGALGVPLRRRADTGEVFAITQISKGGGLRSARLEWALLQVTQAPGEDGVCICQLYNRYLDDTLTDQKVSGYRCLKLGTIRGPLRLRLLDFKTHVPLDSLQVHVSSSGFKKDTGKKVTTDQNGLVPSTGETYAHAAFVLVLSGDKVRARIPVALLSDRTVDCPVSISAAAEAQGQKELRRDRWVRRIYDNLRAASDRVSDLNEMGKKKLRQESLDRAREGLKSLNSELKSLTDERDRLQTEEGVDLSEGEQRLADLAKRSKELDDFVKKLDKILKEKPEKQAVLTKFETGRNLERQAEFQQAIDLYDEILSKHPGEKNVRQRYVDLKKAWATQNKAHRDARDYIYKEWPKLADPAALKASLPKIRAGFVACQQAGDALSPQKIVRVIVSHGETLKKRFAALRPQTRDDDRKEAENIAVVAEGLKQLHKDVTAYVVKEKPKFP